MKSTVRPAPAAFAVTVALLAQLAAAGAVADHLVLGSFRAEDNARRWAGTLERSLEAGFEVERVHRGDGIWYRVRSRQLDDGELARLQAAAAECGLAAWVVHGTVADPGTVTSATPAERPIAPQGSAMLPPEEEITAGEEQGRWAGEGYFDLDVGVQSRTYAETGLAGQERFQPSLSARFTWHRSWNDDRASITVSPFLRLDARDEERTHADLREAFISRVGSDWELHVGARQVFWGVTEFEHLVDIINQTDLVENIDGEDKLGQPMVQLSLVRDWGILDLFALTGFRERTFPGEDGRLRSPLPIDTDHASYASGAGQSRIDGAIRWSHHVGPFSFGLHHFSGTGRAPLFRPVLDGGTVVLRPEYHVIDQTGLDAQAFTGDWAWKLEAITRSGQGERYFAYTAGFERTLVGLLGSRGDLGLVAEYLYDERDEAAYDTLFEHDLALGARWRANDMADTTALVGVITDVYSGDYVVSVEASRRLGPSWLAVLEGRVFGGAEPLDPHAPPSTWMEGDFLTRALQRDDFVQLELTRYF